MTVPMVAFWVSTSGETPVTVAVSEIVPNSSVKLTRAVCCTCNSTSRVAVLKPSSSLFTVYAPGGNAGKSNRPTSLLTVVRVALVALFTTVTVAPGITALVESRTSPVMVPSVCANDGAQRSNDVNATNRVRRIGQGSFREKGCERTRIVIHLDPGFRGEFFQVKNACLTAYHWRWSGTHPGWRR